MSYEWLLWLDVTGRDLEHDSRCAPISVTRRALTQADVLITNRSRSVPELVASVQAPGRVCDVLTAERLEPELNLVRRL
jgi:hypothetical protein